MGVGVLILGESGTGKTHSIKGFKPEEVKIISLFKPVLPFRGSYEVVKAGNADDVIREMKNTKKKVIVVDDFQFLLGVPMMKRIGEKGWDKYNDIQQPYSDVLFALGELSDDTIVYFTSHVEVDDNGKRKIKTIGKALDKYITIEGLFMIVLGTMVIYGEDGNKYYFTTQNNGSDTIKSPEGMFPSYAIDNDLKYVDDKIRNYYEIGDFKSDKEMSEADNTVKHEEIEAQPKRRSRRAAAEETETPAEAPAPRRSRRAAAEEEIAQAGTTEDGESVEFTAEAIELPQRKERTEETPAEDTPAEEAPMRRRRRA